jgi:putative hydrolase of the HAD superfamily
VALRKALLRLGVPYSLALLARYREINLDFWARYRRGEIGPENLARERFCALLTAAGRDASHGGTLGTAYLEELARTGHVRPWSRSVLGWIRARFRTGLVTNGIDWVQRARVVSSGLGPNLEVVVTSDGCGFRKPDPRIVHEALDRLGVRPEEAVLVGDDATADGGAARAAGVRFCWVRHGVPPQMELDPPPFAEITSLRALPAVLRTL